MLVGKRMTKNPVTVRPDDTLAVADARMKPEISGACPWRLRENWLESSASTT
jgi:CBS domain-containing protein